MVAGQKPAETGHMSKSKMYVFRAIQKEDQGRGTELTSKRTQILRTKLRRRARNLK